jgi:disulfide bond formation protein DsbB
MNFKKFLKVVSAIVAIVGVIAGIYVVIQKLTAHKEPEYFDDNDFFECDNEIEIVEAKAEEPEEAPKEEKKALPVAALVATTQNLLPLFSYSS